MKASELRIGNYVKLFLNHSGYNVIQIRIDDLYYINQKNGIYKPIPLTEEWLLKFGFVNINKGNNDFITYTDSKHNYYLQIDIRRRDEKYLILDNSFDDLRAFSMVDIEYVHQLQNIYYCLTGKELNYI